MTEAPLCCLQGGCSDKDSHPRQARSGALSPTVPEWLEAAGDEMAAEMEEEGGGRDAGRRLVSITTRTGIGPAVSLVEQTLSQVSLSSFDPVRFCSSLLSQPSSPGAPESSQVQPVQETRFFPSPPTVLLGLSTTPHREAAYTQMKQPVWTNQREDRKGFFCLIPSI